MPKSKSDYLDTDVQDKTRKPKSSSTLINGPNRPVINSSPPQQQHTTTPATTSARLKLHQSHEQLSLVVEEAPAQLVRVKVQAEQDNQQHKRLSLEMASRTLVASLKSNSPPKSAECPSSHRFSTSAIGNYRQTRNVH